MIIEGRWRWIRTRRLPLLRLWRMSIASTHTDCLSKQDRTVPAGAVAERLEMPPSSLTFHLQHLLRAGLVSQRRVSRQLIYAMIPAAMNDLVGFLTQNCCGGQAVCAPACNQAEAGGPITAIRAIGTTK